MDAALGNVYINPTPPLVNQFEEAAAMRDKAALSQESMADETFTRDGVRVQLLANINLLGELPIARQLKAEGVGLYRTEFPFMVRSTFPTEEEQYQVYRKLCNEMGHRVITFRTLDVGGDKVLSYSDASRETNPELGLRSIRFSLRYRDIFVQQLRAILRAGVESPQMRIMFPLISSLDEFLEARQVVEESIGSLAKDGLPHHNHPYIGLMLELPSTLGIIDELAQEADFLSVGANDFVQYMLAADRSNAKVAEYYRPDHPSVLRGLAKIAEAAAKAGKHVTICGEMAHETQYIPFLIGIGICSLSVDPQSLPRVQGQISRLRASDARRYAGKLLAEPSVEKIREIMMDCDRLEDV
jgi:phosphotransferase system enzyme I (PtsP)